MSGPLPKHRAREYETIFILHPDTVADGTDNVSERCREVISRLDGKLLRAENWGKRRLAYPVRKQPKGTYIYLRYLGYQDLVHELERNLRMLDPVIKYLTVKVDQDVDPEARPVGEGDISFIPRVDSETRSYSSDDDKAAQAPREESEAGTAPVEEAPAKTETPAKEAEEAPVETETKAEAKVEAKAETVEEKPETTEEKPETTEDTE